MTFSKIWKVEKKPRRHYQRDHFTLTAELTQQIEENVSIPDVRDRIEVFGHLIPHRCTKEYFKGRPIDNHHNMDRDLDIALLVEKSIESRRYETLADLQQHLHYIHHTLNKMMQADQDRENVFKVVLVASIFLFVISALFSSFYGWGIFGATVLLVSGITTFIKRRADKYFSSLMEKIMYNQLIEKTQDGD